MICLVCGASVHGTHGCLVCGAAPDGSFHNRVIEGCALESLHGGLRPSEVLLAATRGLFAGEGGGRAALRTSAVLWHAANLGLTSHRWIVQHVDTRSGVAKASADVGLCDVVEVRAEPMEPTGGVRAVRIAVRAQSGPSIRLIAVGRFADGAEALVRVWRSLVPEAVPSAGGVERCAACGREVGYGQRFCPFCGAALQTAAVDHEHD